MPRPAVSAMPNRPRTIGPTASPSRGSDAGAADPPAAGPASRRPASSGPRARCRRRSASGAAHVSMKASVLAADALDVPRRTHAVGHGEPGQLTGVEAGDRPLGRSPLSGSRAAARSSSPGASHSPSRSGANPSQVSVDRRRCRRVRWSSGTREGDERPSLAVRGERVRPAHALGRLSQHGAAVVREREHDLPPATLAREHAALHHAVERRPRRRRRHARALEHLDQRARAERRHVLVDDELAEEARAAAAWAACCATLGPVGGVRIHAHAVGRTASPRLARWICSYTCVRSSVNRGRARVVIWSRSAARSIARSSCTQVGDFESTTTRSPR